MSNAHGGLPGDVPWKRFWIPREMTPALGDGGYLVDPDSDYGKVGNAQARTLEQLEETPCLALLGEPGIGKSYVIDAYRKTMRGGAGEVVDVDFRWHHDLKEKIFATREFRRWRDEGSSLTLLLDSLDEHPLGANAVAAQLVGELRGGPTDRLRLRVACRTAEWPGQLDEQLARLWKEVDDEAPQVAFYALAPLRRADVALAAGPDAVAFLEEVNRVGAEALAIKPITLAFLLDEFRLKNRKLPRERVALYEAGCRRLCEETSLTRADREINRAPYVERRLAIASRIAAICILGRRSLVRVGVVRGVVAPDVVRDDELTGSVEPGEVGDVLVTAAAIDEVLKVTGLFAPRGAGYVGWAHQTYAEFLAARFLRQRGLSAEQLLREVSNPEIGRTVPALRETIAWLASMDKKFFQRLLVIDPGPLLGSDFAGVDDEEREALVATLLEKINNGEEDARTILHRREIQARLAHPRLGDQLRPYLVGRDFYGSARLAAIDIAEGNEIEVLQDDLIKLALDASEDEHVRSAAARAIVFLGSRETKRRLKPLIGGECGPDPNDELKGYALEALWPADLGAAELFASLTPPRRDDVYGGSYASFLYDLERTLTPKDLPEALRWTLGLAPRNDDGLSYAFAGLLDGILRKGWENIQDPSVCAPFAEAVRHRLMIGDGIFQCWSQLGSDAPELERDDHRRHLLVSALVALLPRREHEGADYVLRGFILPRDVSWLIQQLKAEPPSSRCGRWVDILLCFARRPWMFDVVNPIVESLSELDELRDLHPDLAFLYVGIGSPESRQMRREHRQGIKKNAKDKSLFSMSKRDLPPAGKRLRESLRRSERGDWAAATDVLRWMSFHGGHVAPVLDVMKLPGWQNAGSTKRVRIVNAGKRYLLDSVARAQLTAEQHIVGCLYVCLVLNVDPYWFVLQDKALWKKWASARFGSLRLRELEQTMSMVERSYIANPEQVLREIESLLERDHSAHEWPLSIRWVAGCWDERLGQVVLSFVRRSNLKVRFLSALLDELLRNKIAGAAAYAASLLVSQVPEVDAERERFFAIVHALMAYAPEVGWPAVRPHVDADPEFGRAMFLSFSSKVELRRSGVWGGGLTTEDAVEIYAWMEEKFPKHEDAPRLFGGVQEVTPRDMVGDLRDALLRELVSRGTPESIAGLEHIQRAFPKRDFISDILSAKNATAQATWIPRTPREIIELRPLPAPSPASSLPRPEQPPMTRGELLDALRRLLPAQLDTLVFKLEAPVDYLPGREAPQATRSTDLLRWAEQQDRLVDVERLYLAITTSTTSSN